MNGTAYEAPDILEPSDEWKSAYAGACEASPPVAMAITRQLVNDYGIEQQNILIGDPISHIYKHNYDAWHEEFPDIRYIDQSGELWKIGYPSRRYGFNLLFRSGHRYAECGF